MINNNYNWQKYRWGDIATLEYGKALRDYKENTTGYPVFGTNGMIGYSDKKLSNGPGVIIGRKGAYRGVHYTDSPFYVIDTAFYLQPKRELGFDLKWAYYELLTTDINSMDSGSAIPSTSRSDFYNLSVLVPPINIQKGIVQILGRLDDKIELNLKINQTLEQMAMALYKYWFEEFGPFQDGEFVESELGMIPRGWEVIKIGDIDVSVVDYVANGSFSSLKANVTIKEEPDYALFVRNTDLKNNFSSRRYIDNHAYEFLAKTKLYGNEVIISNVADVGSVYLCPKLEQKMSLGNNMIMLNSNSLNFYFHLLFKSEHGQYLIDSITGGSAQLKFNKTDFRNLKVVLPGNQVIEEFNCYIEDFVSLKNKNVQQINRLKEIRDYLLPRLLSGEIDIDKIDVEQEVN